MACNVLICDILGMRLDSNGVPEHAQTQIYIESKGGEFHLGLPLANEEYRTDKIHFFYQPDLNTEQQLLAATAQGQFDAVIAAATYIPQQAKFALGGVRIGAGTGNMGSASWGGGNGIGGAAPLMNTPSFNARATAQMAMKALLQVLPDLDVQSLHDLVVAKNFDTGKNLVEYPTTKLQSKKIAILGYGNIGREVAKLAKAFSMQVTVFARKHHMPWILSEGFNYAATPFEAAIGADVISPHLGLGAFDGTRYENTGIINDDVFSVMATGAVLVNYDRGELVDIKALDRALSSGKIRFAAIDADMFKDPQTGQISGPMLPYLNIYPSHVGKMQLLPHVAADTEHYSRVEGAKQAVDQIFEAIVNKKVINLKGDLPEGYTDGQSFTVNGVGAVTAQNLTNLSTDELKRIAAMTEQLSAFWGALATNALDEERGDEQRDELIQANAGEATKTANRLFAMFADKGLQGPFY